MSSIIYGISSGYVYNIGTYDTGGKKVYLAPVGPPVFDSVRKSLTIGGKSYPLSLNYNQDFRIFKTYTRFRLIMNITKQDGTFTIIGAYSTTSAAFRVYYNTTTKTIGVSACGTDVSKTMADGLILSGGNDLEVILDITNKTVTIKNRINGITQAIVNSAINDAQFLDGAAYSGYDQVLGIGAEVNLTDGKPYQTVPIWEIFFIGITYDAYDVDFDKSIYKYILEKNGEYFHVINDSITSLGTDKEVAFTNTNIFTPIADKDILKNYKMIQRPLFKYLDRGHCINIYKLSTGIEIFPYDDSKNSFVDKSGVNTNPSLPSTTGYTLNEYSAINTLRRVALKVPGDGKWSVNVPYEVQICDKIKSDSIAKDLTLTSIKSFGVKNLCNYGVSATEKFSIHKKINTGVNEVHNILPLDLSVRYPEEVQHGTGIFKMSVYDPNNSMSEENPSSRPLSLFVNDIKSEMFKDYIEYDASDSGLTDIEININSFVCIKLPVGADVIDKPTWLNLGNSKLTGISNRAGKFVIKISKDNIATSMNVIVSMVKRKK